MTPAQLAALHALCFTVPRPWAADEFTDLLDSKGVFVQGDGHGFILGRVIAGEVELLTLAVHPKARRAGIGARLLAGFEQHAQSQGAQDAFLEVAADNTAARALYENAGYASAGLRKSYYQGPRGAHIDALVLRKSFTHS